MGPPLVACWHSLRGIDMEHTKLSPQPLIWKLNSFPYLTFFKSHTQIKCLLISFCGCISVSLIRYVIFAISKLASLKKYLIRLCLCIHIFSTWQWQRHLNQAKLQLLVVTCDKLTGCMTGMHSRKMCSQHANLYFMIMLSGIMWIAQSLCSHFLVKQSDWCFFLFSNLG